MPITTEYKCDSCGHAQDTPQNTGADGSRYMFQVSVCCEPAVPGLNSDRYWPHTSPTNAIWCGQCVDKSGIRKPLLQGDNPAPAYPTFEELVRQIVRSEMEG